MRRMVASIAAAISISCATLGPAYRVDVSSLADTDIQTGKAFVLLPSMDGVVPEDLQFREFAKYVRGALVRRGYVETADPTAADLAVFLAYGIGDPQKHNYTRTVPVYGQIGGGTSTVNLTTVGSGGYSTTYGTVDTPSTYGQTGSVTHTEASTTYVRYMLVDAVDLSAYRASKKFVPVWRSLVTSKGSSGDLRQVFPVLVAASEPYLGVSTSKQVHMDITENDSRVAVVRGAKPH